jgi:O-antigen/teichoic acid export membrane protein
MRLAHIGWNLGGLSLPLIVAAVTVPHLIVSLGHERFGVLALAWGLVGYAGALDLGIGRALTQRVARLRGLGELSAIHGVVATASRITLFAGLVGATLIALAALCGGGGLINAKTVPLGEITGSILLLAIVLPVQAMSATYRGVNEAFLNFKGISMLRIALGVLNFGGPYLVAQFTIELPWLIGTLVLSRALALYVFYRLAYLSFPGPGAGELTPGYSTATAKSLFAFGGWVAVSSAISPILVQADRFLIGAVLSAAAVTAYVLPYEVVVQSLTLVGAISSVIFPVLSKMIAERPDAWKPYFRLWLMRVAALMLLTCVVLAIALPSVLRMWIGAALQPESIVVGQILCVGVFANSLGAMFYALLHAKGRADVTAGLHMVELPVFVAALLYCLHRWGIEGAAVAWVGRMVFDAGALAWLARRQYA